MNILFVCSRNKWRSRTAETIFKNSQKHNVKSAGTSQNARIKLTVNLLIWADFVFVMEKNISKLLRKTFLKQLLAKKLLCLILPMCISIWTKIWFLF